MSARTQPTPDDAPIQRTTTPVEREAALRALFPIASGKCWSAYDRAFIETGAFHYSAAPAVAVAIAEAVRAERARVAGICDEVIEKVWSGDFDEEPGAAVVQIKRRATGYETDREAARTSARARRDTPR